MSLDERIAVKVANRDYRVAYLDPQTAREVVEQGMGSYVDPVAAARALEPPEPEQREPESKKEFACPHCEAVFESQQALAAHGRAHKKQAETGNGQASDGNAAQAGTGTNPDDGGARDDGDGAADSH